MRFQNMVAVLSMVFVCVGPLAGDEACRAQSQSLSRARMLVNERRLVPASEIRADEWINYMDYEFPRLDQGAGATADLCAAMRLCADEPDWSAMLMIAMRTAPYQSVREQPVDLMVVLDRSGSMAAARKMEYAQQALRFLAQLLQAGDRLGLVGFNTEVFPERAVTPWKTGDSLDAELQRLTPAGGTDMNQGLRAGMQMLLEAPPAGDAPDSPERTRRLLVITDAMTNTGEVNVEEIVRGLTPGFTRGVRMSCIGVGVDYNDALLSRLCRIPGNNGRFLDRPDEIRKSIVELCDALLPLEIDKPQMTLTLPTGVSIANSYGTTFQQQGNVVSFTKLTSMGSDDHQIVCLQLRGPQTVLQGVEGAGVGLSAYSPARKAHLALACQVENLSDVDDAARAKPGSAVSVRGRLAEALRKVSAVAQAADGLRCAAVAAEGKDWALARQHITRADAALDVFGPTTSDPQVAQLRQLVILDRDVVKDISGPGPARPGPAIAAAHNASADRGEGLTPVSLGNPPRNWAPAVKSKDLSAEVKKGLAWLVKSQQANGSWGQGEESTQMGGDMANIKSSPNVADTCMGALALFRAGNTPHSGECREAVQKAVAFVCSEIEQSDEKSMFITNLKGTRTQAKLGQYIDTFMASMLLAEVREQMQDEAAAKRAKAAFHKVMDKIEKNQKPDGTWDGQGWAPVLQQSIAAKGINRAAQSGAVVNEGMRAKLEKFSQDNFEVQGDKVALAKPRAAAGDHSETAGDGGFGVAESRAAGRAVAVGGGAGGSAGVDLYAWSANVSALRDQENTNAQKAPELRERLASANDDKEKKELQTTLDRYAANTTALKAAETSLVQNLQDDRFVNGFGSNGGEEFLSYMNIGESLVVNGGEAWEKWDKQITQNLNRIQNQDGSWSGHHCITGRTFCTSAALLVLTVDRAPVPVAADIRQR